MELSAYPSKTQIHTNECVTMNSTNSPKLNQQVELTRVRVIFSRTGPLIYTGALDLQKIWERVLRRAKFNVAYTQGFNPGPRINLASAIPLGISGERELADFWFIDPPNLASFCEQVNQASPVGLRAITTEVVPLSTPALQTRVDSAEYRTSHLPAEQFMPVKQAVERVLATDSLPRERRGKPYDLRPLILELKAIPEGDGGRLEMTLAAREGATGRADEVLSALDINPGGVAITRTKLLLKPYAPVVK